MLTGGIGQPGYVSPPVTPAISANGAVVSASVLTGPGHITGARYYPSALTGHA